MSSGQCLRNRGRQLVQSRGNIRPEVDSQGSSFAIHQHLEVTSRLRRLHDSERILSSRHLYVGSIVACDLQHDTRVWTALVSLPGRVQEPRTKTEAGGHSFLVT